MLGRLFTGWGTATTLVTPAVLVAIAVGLAAQYVPRDAVNHGLVGFSRLRPVRAGPGARLHPHGHRLPRARGSRRLHLLPVLMTQRKHTLIEGRRVSPAGHVLLTGLLFLGLATFLNAASLLKTAERQPAGAVRTLAVGIMDPLAQMSGVLLLDRPRRLMDWALGRAAAEEPDDDGILAAPPVTILYPEGGAPGTSTTTTLAVTSSTTTEPPGDLVPPTPARPDEAVDRR